MREDTKAIVRLIRGATRCERCGGQPIEWHHDDHPANPERRVANLVDDGKPLEMILAEIDVCRAYCHKCHATLDGRAELLRTMKHRRGEDHASAKLSDVQVTEIRERFAADPKYGFQSQLAREYGVSPKTINHLVRGRRR